MDVKEEEEEEGLPAAKRRETGDDALSFQVPDAEKGVTIIR